MKRTHFKTAQYALVGLVFFLSFGCQSKSEKEAEDQLFEIPLESDSTPDTLLEVADESFHELIRTVLVEEFKKDISLDLIDSASRVYKYSLVDLDSDGNNEIMVGLTGPFFCGSGGCTSFLLSGSGAVITRFSVVRYPIFVDQERTNGWSNLVMYSGGENRINVFDGKSYKSNPSTLKRFTGDVDSLTQILDWEVLEANRF